MQVLCHIESVEVLSLASEIFGDFKRQVVNINSRVVTEYDCPFKGIP